MLGLRNQHMTPVQYLDKFKGDKIIENVYKMLGVPVESIKGSLRKKEIMEARSFAIYLIKINTNLTLKCIGSFFFDKPLDHTTVLHHVNKHEELISINDKRVNYLISNYNLFFN